MIDNYSSNPNTPLEIGEFSILMNPQCVDCGFKELVFEESPITVGIYDVVNVYRITCKHAKVCQHFVTKS